MLILLLPAVMSWLRKPTDEIVNVDFPEGKLRLKFPEALVVVPVLTSFFTKTLAPANGFPASSFTVPVTVFWAVAPREKARKAQRKTGKVFIVRLFVVIVVSIS